MAIEDILKELDEHESKLEKKILTNGKEEAKKIKSLLKELESFKEKYQKAKSGGKQKDMAGCYSNAVKSIDKLKTLLAAQNEFYTELYNKINGFYNIFNSDAKEFAKEFLGVGKK